MDGPEPPLRLGAEILGILGALPEERMLGMLLMLRDGEGPDKERRLEPPLLWFLITGAGMDRRLGPLSPL